jgi:hypothetical protein
MRGYRLWPAALSCSIALNITPQPHDLESVSFFPRDSAPAMSSCRKRPSVNTWQRQLNKAIIHISQIGKLVACQTTVSSYEVIGFAFRREDVQD